MNFLKAEDITEERYTFKNILYLIKVIKCTDIFIINKGKVIKD